MSGTIAWVFSFGHGHQAQFKNFRESCPGDLAARSLWVGMDFGVSGDWLANLPFVPDYVRRRRHEMWHLKDALLHGAGDESLFLASWNLRLVPYMWRFPSYLYVDFSPSRMRSLSPWYDHFFKPSPLQNIRELAATALPRSARGIFTMSRWSAEGIVEDYGISPERVHVVLPGANLRTWHFVDRSNRSEAHVRILMVGGEFARKGGDLLLAWAEANQHRDVGIDIVTWPGQLPPRVLELLGRLPPSGSISRTLSPWLPNVTIHCGLSPNTPPLLALYERADIFCLPTRADFSSIASLEAMATGLPVIVGKVGGIPELVRGRETAFLLEPSDPGALGACLDELIADRALRLRVGASARAECERHLNIERQMLEIASIIDADRARA